MARYDGTDGNDVYVGGDQGDSIYGNDGDDTLGGGGGNDLIDGGDGDDMLSGDDGADSLYAGGGENVADGGTGNDTIYSVGGIDTVNGGDGSDTWVADYSRSAVPLTFDDATGVLSNGTRLDGIEWVKLTTGYGEDRFDMGVRRFAIDGGAGRDLLGIDLSDLDTGTAPYDTAAITYDGVGFSGSLLGGLSTFKNVEQVTFQGAELSDAVTVSTMREIDPTLLRIDAGGGVDSLTMDLRAIRSVDFEVDEQDRATSTVGEYLNFERYNFTFGGGDNRFVLDDGDDTIEMSSTVVDPGTNYINAAGGADIIRLYGGANQVRCGAGDDRASLSGSSFNGQLDIDGGDGFDSIYVPLNTDLTFDQRSGQLSTGAKITNFEHFYFKGVKGTHNLFFYSSHLDIFSKRDAGSVDNFYFDLSSETVGVRVSSGSGGTIKIGESQIRNADAVHLIGTSGDDTLAVSLSYGQSFSFDGGPGIDTLTLGYYGQAAPFTLIVGDDGVIESSALPVANVEKFYLLLGGNQNEVQLGGFDDHVEVRGASSSVSGGGGDDELIADGNGNSLRGEDGADTLTASSGDVRLFGGDGDDLIKGGFGNDLLGGGAGNDILDGGFGVDTANYLGAKSAVAVTLASTAQQDTGGAGLDLIINVENLTGSLFGDQLTGNDGANRLEGSDGDDALTGGGGDDVLVGGVGADRMTGGQGADAFAILDVADVAGRRHDVVQDFSHAEGDRIDLSAIVAGSSGAFTFIGMDAFSGDGEAELRVRYQPRGTALVMGDVDGDGRSDFAIQVHADALLQASDFIL